MDHPSVTGEVKGVWGGTRFGPPVVPVAELLPEEELLLPLLRVFFFLAFRDASLHRHSEGRMLHPPHQAAFSNGVAAETFIEIFSRRQL